MPPSPRRRRRRWLLALALFEMTVLIGGFWLFWEVERLRFDRRWRDAVAETDARDLGWRWEDLERTREPAPAVNSADVVLRINNQGEFPKRWPLNPVYDEGSTERPPKSANIDTDSLDPMPDVDVVFRIGK